MIKHFVSNLTKHNLAVLALIIVAACYALLGVVARILSTGFAPMTQVYVRISVGFLVSLLLFGKQVRWPKIRTTPKMDWFWLLIMGVMGYAISVWAITQANISAKLVNASVIYASVPFVVYVYAIFLLKEKFRPWLIGLLLVSLYGTGMVAAKSFVPSLSGFGVGEIWAVVSVLAGGFWSVGIKKLSSHLKSREVTAVVMLIAAIAGLTIALLKGETLSLASFTHPLVLVGIAMGAILNVAATFGENYGFKNIDVVVGNQILMLSTVFAMVLGLVLYGEMLSLPELMGGAVILISVLAANRTLSKIV